MNPSALTGCKTSPFTKLPQSQNPTGSNAEWTKTAPHLPPHHSHPAAPESLPTCTLPRVGHPVTLPPFLSPLLTATSSQAPHPSSPRQLYQSQLWVCADLFLIAGAWFTLAHPPPILSPLFGESLTSGTWMGAKTAFSRGLDQGPAPTPRFHGGAQKGQLMGQGHMTSVLRGWAHLTFWGPL